MFLIFTPHKTRTFTVLLAITTKYQGNGFAAQMLLGRDHPRVVPIGPIVRGVIAFPILGTWWDTTTKVASQWSICRRVMAFRILSNNDNLPTFNIWSHDCHCHCCLNLLLYTKFHQNWFTRSASRRPSLMNVQSAVARPVARKRPLPWQPNFGGHVGNVMGCDQPSFVPIGQLLGELWYFQYFSTWRPSALLSFKNFNIWSHDCHCGPNVLLCSEFNRNRFTRSASRRP